MTTEYKLIAHNRFFATLTRKKLDRARWLYTRLVWPMVRDAKLPTLTAYRLALKAKTAGLYAPTTYLKDITYSLMRKWFRMFSPTLPWWDGYKGWHDWLEEHELVLRPTRWQLARWEEEDRRPAAATVPTQTFDPLLYEDW